MQNYEWLTNVGLTGENNIPIVILNITLGMCLSLSRFYCWRTDRWTDREH